MRASKWLNIKSHLSSQSEPKVQWIETIHSNKEYVIVDVIYGYPKKKWSEFLWCLKQTFKILSREKGKVILTGDFNVNLLNFDKRKQENEFLDPITSTWFTSKIFRPTIFIEHNIHSIADNIFVNVTDMWRLNRKNNWPPAIFFLIMGNFNTHLRLKPKPLKRYFTHFKKENL